MTVDFIWVISDGKLIGDGWVIGDGECIIGDNWS